MFGLVKKIQNNIRKSEEDFLRNCIEKVKNDKFFVEHTKDSSKDRIQITGFIYCTNTEGVGKRSYFNLCYIPAIQEYIFEGGFACKNLPSAQELYKICTEKLQDKTYYARKLNALRKEVKKFNAANATERGSR